MAGAASEALSFKLFGFTVVGLSERNDARQLGRRAAKNYHHPAPFNGVVAHKATLGVGLVRVSSRTRIAALNMIRAASRGNCLSRTLIAFFSKSQVNSMRFIICINICI
jgi:hypothetical protein